MWPKSLESFFRWNVLAQVTTSTRADFRDTWPIFKNNSRETLFSWFSQIWTLLDDNLFLVNAFNFLLVKVTWRRIRTVNPVINSQRDYHSGTAQTVIYHIILHKHLFDNVHKFSSLQISSISIGSFCQAIKLHFEFFIWRIYFSKKILFVTLLDRLIHSKAKMKQTVPQAKLCDWLFDGQSNFLKSIKFLKFKNWDESSRSPSGPSFIFKEPK